MGVGVGVGGSKVGVGGIGVGTTGSGVAVGASDTFVEAGAPHPTKNTITIIIPITCCSNFWQFIFTPFIAATSRKRLRIDVALSVRSRLIIRSST